MNAIFLLAALALSGCACRIGMSDRAIAEQCKECYQQREIPIIWTGSYGIVWGVLCIDTTRKSDVPAPIGRMK